MKQLFPIIRRKRRPLVVGDAPPVMVGNVEPVNANAETETLGASDVVAPQKSEDTSRED